MARTAELSLRVSLAVRLARLPPPQQQRRAPRQRRPPRQRRQLRRRRNLLLRLKYRPRLLKHPRPWRRRQHRRPPRSSRPSRRTGNVHLAVAPSVSRVSMATSAPRTPSAWGPHPAQAHARRLKRVSCPVRTAAGSPLVSLAASRVVRQRDLLRLPSLRPRFQCPRASVRLVTALLPSKERWACSALWSLYALAPALTRECALASETVSRLDLTAASSHQASLAARLVPPLLRMTLSRLRRLCRPNVRLDTAQ